MIDNNGQRTVKVVLALTAEELNFLADSLREKDSDHPNAIQRQLNLKIGGDLIGKVNWDKNKKIYI